jgi:hypothetical protein
LEFLFSVRQDWRGLLDLESVNAALRVLKRISERGIGLAGLALFHERTAHGHSRDFNLVHSSTYYFD